MGQTDLTVIPIYDPPGYCRQVIESVGAGFSAVRFASCIEQEEEAYDGLKPIWPTLPLEVTGYCHRLVTYAGKGNYVLLQACVEQELEARAAMPVFRF